MRTVTDCWDLNSRHVTQVSLTPPRPTSTPSAIAIQINMMPQTITPRADLIVYCGAKTLNSGSFGISSALCSVISSDSKYACGCFPADSAPVWKTQRSKRRLDVRRSSTHGRDKASQWKFNQFRLRMDLYFLAAKTRYWDRKTNKIKNKKKLLLKPKSDWWSLGKRETVTRVFCCWPHLTQKLIVLSILLIQSVQ